MTWRQRHVDVVLVRMLLSNIVGDVGKCGKTISLILGSGQRLGNEIASNLVHVESMIGFINQSFHVQRLLSIDLALSLLLCFGDELQERLYFFLHDILSVMVILRLNVLPERLMVQNSSRCVSTSTSIGFRELLMEREKVSLRTTLFPVFIFIVSMCLLKKGDVTVESFQMLFLDLPTSLIALHLKQFFLPLKSSVFLFNKVVVAHLDQGLGLVSGLLKTFQNLIVLWHILVSFGLPAHFVDVSCSKRLQNINLLSTNRAEYSLELLLSGFEYPDGVLFIFSQDSFARRLWAIVSPATGSTSTSTSAITIEITATTTSASSATSNRSPWRASCWTTILAWSLTSRFVSSLCICSIVGSFLIVVARPVAFILPLFMRDAWIVICVAIRTLLLGS